MVINVAIRAIRRCFVKSRVPSPFSSPARRIVVVSRAIPRRDFTVRADSSGLRLCVPSPRIPPRDGVSFARHELVGSKSRQPRCTVISRIQDRKVGVCVCECVCASARAKPLGRKKRRRRKRKRIRIRRRSRRRRRRSGEGRVRERRKTGKRWQRIVYPGVAALRRYKPRLCVRPREEGVCIGLVPSRSRLKLITSSSDVTGLWPMRATSLASSIARYHFTGFYPVPVSSSSLPTDFPRSRRISASRAIAAFSLRERTSRTPAKNASRGMDENAADKLGDFAYS